MEITQTKLMENLKQSIILIFYSTYNFQIFNSSKSSIKKLDIKIKDINKIYLINTDAI